MLCGIPRNTQLYRARGNKFGRLLSVRSALWGPVVPPVFSCTPSWSPTWSPITLLRMTLTASSRRRMSAGLRYWLIRLLCSCFICHTSGIRFSRMRAKQHPITSSDGCFRSGNQVSKSFLLPLSEPLACMPLLSCLTLSSRLHLCLAVLASCTPVRPRKSLESVFWVTSH